MIEPVVPLRSGNSTLWPSALMKLHSPVARMTSPGCGGTRARLLSPSASSQRWACTTPLGLPVVPEVKTMKAGVSRPCVERGGQGVEPEPACSPVVALTQALP